MHLPEKPVLQRVLNDLNYFFAAVFTLEFCLKLVGLGMVAYFSSFWNCLDCFIVIVSNTRTSIYPTVLQVTLVFSVGLSQRNSHVSRYSQGNMSILIVEHLSKFANVRTKNSCCALINFSEHYPFLKLYLELSMSFITVFVGRSFCHHLSSDSLLSRSLHIHPSSRSPTHSPAQSLFILSPTHPFTHSLPHSTTQSVTPSLTHSSPHQPLIIQSLSRSLTQSESCPKLINPSIWRMFFFFTSFIIDQWSANPCVALQISLVCVVDDSGLAVFRSLRTVRALRPLRAVSRMEGMKVSCRTNHYKTTPADSADLLDRRGCDVR